ncbi:MAG: hypothetical protein WC277_09110 [Bacilli bacterium]
MNLTRLIEIIKDATEPLRKGEVVVEEGNVTSLYFMRHVSESSDEIVDLHFIAVGVNREKAEHRREEFVGAMQEYVQEHPRFLQGTSYIEVGSEIGSQEMAFRLFAIGNVLDIWDILTPEKVGVNGVGADILAGRGFIMTVNHRGLKA